MDKNTLLVKLGILDKEVRVILAERREVTATISLAQAALSKINDRLGDAVANKAEVERDIWLLENDNNIKSA
jgi:hypothetical protein